MPSAKGDLVSKIKAVDIQGRFSSTGTRAQETSLLLLYIIAALAALIALSITFAIKTEERTQLKMGTFVKITLRGPCWFDFDAAFKKTFAAVDRVDAIASAYNSNSELSRLNRTAHLRPVVVSNDLFILIRDSIRLSQDSDGAFDITVGPLVKLWRVYKESESFPADDEIKRNLSLVGYNNIILDENNKSIFFKKEGVALDLSAIAKGYAVDRAVGVLRKQGFKSAIVNAGGDLYCLGKKNFFRRWCIGVADPQDKTKIAKLLYISNGAAATSGGYEQYFTYRGKDYTHLIDPKTGHPKESRFSSVTVIAPNCTLADGLATAVSVGGEVLIEDLKKFYPGVEVIAEGIN